MPISPPSIAPRPGSPVVERVIGHSAEGRAIRVHLPANQADAVSVPRVLILAGQHGDEPLAREAVAGLLSRSLSGLGLRLAIIADANPDGAANNGRCNARGLDLNRDHQRLAAPETQAIHRFAREWQPDLVIDVHTFPPRRQAMIARGVTYLQDVQFDSANNPTLPEAVRIGSERLLEHLLNVFSSTRFHATRYTLFRSDGRVRHSTPDLVDARNGLALRLGVPALLIEGRQPARSDPINRSADTVAAIQRAIHATFAWVAQQTDLVKRLRWLRWQPIDRVCVRSKLLPGVDAPFMLLADATTGEPKRFDLPPSYTSEVIPTRSVTIPIAYAIPKRLEKILSRLKRHGFVAESPTLRLHKRVERYRLDEDSAGTAPSTKRSTARWRRSNESDVDLGDYVVFPTTQCGGSALAAHLEPRAKYSIGRGSSSRDLDEVIRLL